VAKDALLRIRKHMEAMQLLTIPPDNTDHKIALALEASLRFVELGDTTRALQARACVPSTAQIAPSASHAPVKPLGPSTIKELADPNIFSVHDLRPTADHFTRHATR
jgi:hypothetical protein